MVGTALVLLAQALWWGVHQVERAGQQRCECSPSDRRLALTVLLLVVGSSAVT